MLRLIGMCFIYKVFWWKIYMEFPCFLREFRMEKIWIYWKNNVEIYFGFFFICCWNKCLILNIGLGCFGGLQGVIGWWMVKSGLTKKPDYQSRQRVSTYRLFVHLNCAIIIYSSLLWNGLTLVSKNPENVINLSNFKNCSKLRT